MKPPLTRRKMVQLRQFFDHLLGWMGETFERLGALLRHRISLRMRHRGRKHNQRAEERDRKKPLRRKGTVMTTKKGDEHANGLPKTFAGR
jgi:hypothetical protein